MPASDEELMATSLRVPAAFGELVGRHGPAVHAYLARRAGVDVADDLLADTWLAAFGSRSGYDHSRGPVRAWLFGVARHVLLAHHRAPRSGAAVPDLDDGDQWAAVDARLDAAAVTPALRAGLGALSPPDRELLLLVSWEQLSPSQAAAVLGIPAGTARSRLHRCRRLLRAHLGAGPPGPAAGPDPAPPLPTPSRRPR